MKKTILFIVMIFCASFISAQDAVKVDKIASQEMEKLTKIVTYADQSLAFNKNQEAKLQSLMKEKATEIQLIKETPLEKADGSKKLILVADKYETKIKQILTSNQRVAYKRFKNKQIPFSKG